MRNNCRDDSKLSLKYEYAALHPTDGAYIDKLQEIHPQLNIRKNLLEIKAALINLLLLMGVEQLSFSSWESLILTIKILWQTKREFFSSDVSNYILNLRGESTYADNRLGWLGAPKISIIKKR